MSEYWSKNVVESWQCSNCGGELMKDGCAPVVKGHIMRYRCIRCSSTGSVKEKLGWDNPKVTGTVQRPEA